MKPWIDLPLEQWIFYKKETTRDGRALHKQPWCVYVGNEMYIRARYEHEYQAQILVNRLKAAFDNDVLFIPKPGAVSYGPILIDTPALRNFMTSRSGSKSSAKKDSRHGKSRKASASRKQRSTKG